MVEINHSHHPNWTEKGRRPSPHALSALGRQLNVRIERRVDIALPNLARQFVKQLNAVAVGVVDIEALRRAVIDAALESRRWHVRMRAAFATHHDRATL